MSLYQIKKYPQFLFKSKNQHGVHSPFVFELIHEVFTADKTYYAFEEIEKTRNILLNDHSLIDVTDMGAGSHQMKKNKRKVSAIAKYSLTPAKQAQILFRLANKFQPKHIFELGTSLGIMTTYFSKSCPNSQITSFEGCPNVSIKANEVFSELGINNVELIVGNMDETLSEKLEGTRKIDFAFIDGNHRKAPTLNYTNQIIKKSHSNSILILDDIYWSSEMNDAWEELKNHPQVTISIDIFHKGFLFFRKGIEKQHFYLRV